MADNQPKNEAEVMQQEEGNEEEVCNPQICAGP